MREKKIFKYLFFLGFAAMLFFLLRNNLYLDKSVSSNDDKNLIGKKVLVNKNIKNENLENNKSTIDDVSNKQNMINDKEKKDEKNNIDLENNIKFNIETKNFNIRIKNNCKIGEVTCDNVEYIGVDKKSNKKIILIGSTYHSMNNNIPGRFLGYIFKNNNYQYIILETDKLLLIEKDNKIIYSEKIIRYDI